MAEPKLVSMKLSKADQKEEMSPISATTPQFPYGLCLRLDGDELDKLGITALPSVGDEFRINASGCVTSVAELNRADAESRNVEIQITMLGLENEGQPDGDESIAEEEGEDAETTTVMSSTYRGK